MSTPFVDVDFIYGAGTSINSGSLNLGSDPGRSVEVVITCPNTETLTGAAISGGGTSLALISSNLFNTGNYARQYVFAGVVTETGAQSVTVTSTGGGLKYGVVTSRSNVASIRGGASGANNTAPNDHPSLNATTVAGDTVSLSGHDCERASSWTAGGGATARFSGGSAFVQDQIASGTNTTASGTFGSPGGAGPWIAGAVVLVPIPGPGPSITDQPDNATATEPNTQAFALTYTGDITGHQWQVSTNGGSSWANVTDGTGQSGGAGSGATLTYTTTGVAVATGNHRHGYQYRCRLTHSGGTVDSGAATLSVDPAAPTHVAPSSISSVGATVNWSNNAAGSPTTQVQIETPSGAGNWVDATGSTNPTAANAASYAATGLTPSTQYRDRKRSIVSGRQSAWTVGSAFTTTAGGDVVVPTLTGAITVSSLTQTGYTLSWPAGSDNVAVTSYERSLDGGSSWVDVGNVLTVNITGRTPGSTDQVRIRAKDAAGNVSTPPLSTSVVLPTYTATFGPFGNNTGMGQRAAGQQYEGWLFPGVRIGQSMAGVTPVVFSGTLNGSGLAVVTGLTVPGACEAQFYFPNDTGEKGTARTQGTAA